ncbi:MAG: tRNA lysidine(34) synthetase TilS [Trueperaceae bacterium]
MIQQKFFQYLYSLAPSTKKFIVAVSGGSDSIALLRLMKESGREFEVAHFDHALRDSSSQDAEFIKALCQRIEIRFHSERVDVAKVAKEKKWNLEDAARRLRYSFLAKAAKEIKANAIFTAHTQDDQAETVLMQLLRGAAHLTGMCEVQGNVIRPLLSTSKQEILEYLANIQQDFCTDESNLDTTRTRAWLRHEIFPKLEQQYPYVKNILAKLARLQSENEDYLAGQSQRFIQNKKIDLDLLRRAHPALQRQVVVSLLEQHHAPITKNALQRILELLSETETVQVSLSSMQSAALSGGRLRVIAKGENPKLIQSDSETDEAFMKQALRLAVLAAKQDELPVGCVIVKDNHIIAEAHNETETTKDPTAHAEVLAMRRAAEKFGDWRLESCTLYVTLEPCPMCFGTILQAHVSKVVYGARNARDGALGSVMDMQNALWKRNVEVKSGVLAKECGKLLTDFFEKKRKD